MTEPNAAEEWRPVIGHEGTYEVSNFGRVRSFARQNMRFLKTSEGGYGYLQVNIQVAGKSTRVNVHKLVAQSFIGPRPKQQEVRHADGNRMNAQLSNLSYGTRSENNRDAVSHGTHHWAIKTHCPKGHPYDELNTRMYRGKRNCRTCQGWKGLTTEITHRRSRRAK